jgi:glycosyltransferase involved in cell wall biosynthesis
MKNTGFDGRPLRIAIISKATAPGGGASRVAQDLTCLLRGAGHTADHWTGYYSGPPSPHIRQLHGLKARPLVRGVHRLTQRLGFQELLPVEYLLLARELERYDIAHFHDITFAASPLTVLLTSLRIPTAWTFHDCSAFTGGCIQPLGCEQLEKGCGQCPQRDHWPLAGYFDGTSALKRLKALTAEFGRWQAVAPSKWMVGMASRSGLLNRPPELIPNGVDCEIFQPRDKAALRDRFGFPGDESIALFSAGSISDRFKGIPQALAALEMLGVDAPYLMVIGKLDTETRKTLGRFRHREVGYVRDTELLAMHYAACDMLLYPTIADNMPLTVLEGMASGVPAVACAVGGIPEMIEDGVNGLLCASGDVSHMAQLVRDLLDFNTVRNMGLAARTTVVTHFSHKEFLSRHIKLYECMRHVCAL